MGEWRDVLEGLRDPEKKKKKREREKELMETDNSVGIVGEGMSG